MIDKMMESGTSYSLKRNIRRDKTKEWNAVFGLAVPKSTYHEPNISLLQQCQKVDGHVVRFTSPCFLYSLPLSCYLTLQLHNRDPSPHPCIVGADAFISTPLSSRYIQSF